MPRIVPSQVVAIIDQYFSWAKDWSLTKTPGRIEAGHAEASWFSGFVDLLGQIPEELLIIRDKEASEFLMARAALGKAAQLTIPGEGPVRLPMLGERDCIEIVRAALEKCPDQAPSTSREGFPFIKTAIGETPCSPI